MDSSSYDGLSALGAPLTLQEYTRLANGPLGDALTFLSEHLVGRHAAASARTTIFLSAPSSFPASHLSLNINATARTMPRRNRSSSSPPRRVRAQTRPSRASAQPRRRLRCTRTSLRRCRRKCRLLVLFHFISILCGVADFSIRSGAPRSPATHARRQETPTSPPQRPRGETHLADAAD